MIVDTMTWREIADEILADLNESEIIDRSITIARKHEHDIKKAMAKTQETVFFKNFSIKSKRNNRFYAMPYAEGKSGFKRMGTLLSVCASFYLQNHLWIAYIGFFQGNYGICFMSHHLFERYAQRFSKETIDESIIRYVLRFIANNKVLCSSPITRHKTGKEGLFLRINDGIALGEEIDGVEVYRTFITEEMLFESQQQNNIETKTTLDEKSKDFYDQYRKQKNRA